MFLCLSCNICSTLIGISFFVFEYIFRAPLSDLVSCAQVDNRKLQYSFMMTTSAHISQSFGDILYNAKFVYKKKSENELETVVSHHLLSAF